MKIFHNKKTGIATLLASSLLVNFNIYAEFKLPRAPMLDVAAFALLDEKTGQIIAEYNSEEKRDPASLTKIMTSYVIGDALKNNSIYDDDVVIIKKNAWAAGNPILKGSSLMFLEPGNKVKVSDLNKGIIIQSGNDACIALAEHIAGNQENFVRLMNQFSQKLGLDKTYFQTVHGLDAPGQYTTAKDIAYLSKALINDLPEEYKIYREKEFTFNGIKQNNRNGLLWDKNLNVDGIKTGHTNAAGYNLAASATQDDMRLISVVLGAKSQKNREDESKKLLNWGFRYFTTHKAFSKYQKITEAKIWYGKNNNIPLGTNEDILISVPRKELNKLVVRYEVNKEELNAPLKDNTNVGKIIFSIDDLIITEKPLVTLESIDEAGFFGKTIDYIKLKIKNIFD